MADEQLNVHDITVAESPVISLSGPIKRLTIVRYFIGNHGPFQDQYDSDKADSATIKAGIDRRVGVLRGGLSGY